MALLSSNRYNSGAFASISESYNHSLTNPVLLQNVSKKVLYQGKFILNDPWHIFKQYKEILEKKKSKFQVTESLKYRPKAISEAIYSTPDLWYLIFMANGFSKDIQIVPGIIDYYNFDMVKFILNSAEAELREIEKTKDSPVSIGDFTVTPLGI
jgi:hypothetical protein